MSVAAFPLSWPAGWRRTQAEFRQPARFHRRDKTTWGARSLDLTIADGVDRVLGSLRRMGADPETIIISSDVPLRRDGTPRSTAGEPDDPGVAVYFTLDGEPECIAAHLYERLADNLAAVAATIEAMAAIQRHGGAEILKRTFQGFKQLPASTDPTMAVDSAWAILAHFAGIAPPDPEQRKLRSIAQDTARHAPEDFSRVQRAADTLSAHFGWAL